MFLQKKPQFFQTGYAILKLGINCFNFEARDWSQELSSGQMKVCR